MKILLVDNGTSLLNKLQKLIPGSEFVVNWTNIDKYDYNSFDLIILSGSRNSSVVWNHADFKKEIGLIRSSVKPIIGICFGCELIVHAFGGKLKELRTPIKGVRKIKMLSKDFTDKTIISIYENHRWIVELLPKEFEVLAKSSNVPEIIKHKFKPIYGLQFHPENFTSETSGDEVFLSILSKLNIH